VLRFVSVHEEEVVSAAAMVCSVKLSNGQRAILYCSCQSMFKMPICVVVCSCGHVLQNMPSFKWHDVSQTHKEHRCNEDLVCAWVSVYPALVRLDTPSAKCHSHALPEACCLRHLNPAALQGSPPVPPRASTHPMRQSSALVHAYVAAPATTPLRKVLG
jgi:hypothetical protein